MFICLTLTKHPAPRETVVEIDLVSDTYGVVSNATRRRGMSRRLVLGLFTPPDHHTKVLVFEGVNSIQIGTPSFHSTLAKLFKRSPVDFSSKQFLVKLEDKSL